MLLTAVAMKSTFLWDVTVSRPVKVKASLPPTFTLVSFLAYLALKMVAIPPKLHLTSSGLHGIIAHKIALLKHSTCLNSEYHFQSQNLYSWLTFQCIVFSSTPAAGSTAQ
jgi:hypothetical protein